MLKYIATILFFAVPICCSAEGKPEMKFFEKLFSQSNPEDTGEKPTTETNELRKFQEGILRSILPFCRTVQWEDQEVGFGFSDFYGNWGFTGFFSKLDWTKPASGCLQMWSLRRPLPAIFPCSTAEEGIALLQSSDFLFDAETKVECTVLDQTENTLLVSLVGRGEDVVTATILKCVFLEDWVHMIHLEYSGFDELDLLDFQKEELPILTDWLKKLEIKE